MLENYSPLPDNAISRRKLKNLWFSRWLASYAHRQVRAEGCASFLYSAPRQRSSIIDSLFKYATPYSYRISNVVKILSYQRKRNAFLISQF